jgi:hypothetical protein
MNGSSYAFTFLDSGVIIDAENSKNSSIARKENSLLLGELIQILVARVSRLRQKGYFEFKSH